MKCAAAVLAALPLLPLLAARWERAPGAWVLPPPDLNGDAEGVLGSGPEPRLLRLPGGRVAVLEGTVAWRSEAGSVPELQLLVIQGRVALEGRSLGPRRRVRITEGPVAHLCPAPREPGAFFGGEAESAAEPGTGTVAGEGRLSELGRAVAVEDAKGFAAAIARWRGRPARGRELLLLAAMETGDPGLRALAASEATAGEVVLLLEPLRALLAAGDAEARLVALGALCRAGDVEAVAAIESACRGADGGLRARLARAAGPVMPFLTPEAREHLRQPGAPGPAVPEADSGRPASRSEGQTAETHGTSLPSGDAAIAAALRAARPPSRMVQDRAERLGTADPVLLAIAAAVAGDPARLDAWAAADPGRFLETLDRWNLPCPPERLEELIEGRGPDPVRARALSALAHRAPGRAAAAALRSGAGDPAAALRSGAGGSLAFRSVSAMVLGAVDGGSRQRRLVEDILARPFQPGAGTLLDVWAGRGWTRLSLECWLDGVPGIPGALALGDRDLAAIEADEAWAAVDIRDDVGLRRFERGRRARRRRLEAGICEGLESRSARVRSEALDAASCCPGFRVLDALERLVAAGPEPESRAAERALRSILGRGPAAVEVSRLGRREAWSALVTLLRPGFQPPGEGLLPAARAGPAASGG